MALSAAILAALESPCSAAELAQQLAVPVVRIEQELLVLAQRGYVDRLDCVSESGTREHRPGRTWCVLCGLRATCAATQVQRWHRRGGRVAATRSVDPASLVVGVGDR